MSEDPPAQGMTQTPAYARGGGGTLPPAYAFGASPQTPVEGLISLLTLHELRERRTIALEAPTVFGRKSRLHRYPASMNRFSGADAKVLERLDYVRITGQDSRISRTHGVLDPASFTIRDLNSANGIRVNGALIGRTPGHPGPPHPLASEDIVQLGQTEFLVGVERITREALLERLARSRRGFVGPAGVPEAERLGGFLRERKRFEVHACETWAGMLQTVGALRYSAPIFGVIVLAWVVEPLGGDRMRVGDEEVGLDALLFMLGTIPGSKVLALQSKGDPAGLEAVFRDLALQDTILLTSTIPDTGGLEPDGVLPEIGTIPADALRQSVADGGGLFDSIVDGLDALVSPESNVLRVEWAERYEGALRMVVGTRRPSADVEVELSYQPSSEGTVRVTHTLSNTLTGPSAGEDTLIGL